MMNMNSLSDMQKLASNSTSRPGSGSGSSSVETFGGTIAKVPDELMSSPSFTGNVETIGGMAKVPFTAQEASRMPMAKQQEIMRQGAASAPHSTTAMASAAASQPIRSPINQALIEKELARQASAAQSAAPMADAADLPETNVLRQVLEAQNAAAEAQEPSFTGGLGVSNIKHMRGSQMVSDARQKRSEASSLRSQARREENMGNHARANSLRSQASRLESEANSLEQKGRALMREADNDRKRAGK